MVSIEILLGQGVVIQTERVMAFRLRFGCSAVNLVDRVILIKLDI